jgi:SAM-dependent methyltransferase
LFVAPAESYDNYMGRYSRRLAPLFADFAGVEPGMGVLDVGCGPGALTVELVARAGAGNVAAVDPSTTFAEACATRAQGADVRQAPAERLPWDDDTFDAALSQLVVNFMEDAPRGVREMRRVTRSGGTVCAATWDAAGGMEMLKVFWGAARDLDPEAPDEGAIMRYCTSEELGGLWQEAGLNEVTVAPLEVAEEYASFDEFWAPYSGGVGPAGSYFVSLSPEQQEALRTEVRGRLGDPQGAITLRARAWAARGRA